MRIKFIYSHASVVIKLKNVAYQTGRNGSPCKIKTTKQDNVYYFSVGQLQKYLSVNDIGRHA